VSKRALITGVTGQDGAYLTRLLLDKGYEVHGVKRRTSLINTDRVNEFFDHPNFHLHYGNLHDGPGLNRLVLELEPDEVYNLGAQSHVKVSFEVPEETVDAVAVGTLRLLEAIRLLRDVKGKGARFYQASSSEMYGDNPEVPQNEETRMTPASPYACAKLFSHGLVRNYRLGYGMHASSGILFNHESPLRGETFVTRKITMAAANIKLGRQSILELGNLDAKRDWGFAGDYVEAMWLMLQQRTPDDYVIATGETHTVQEFLDKTFEIAGLKVEDHVRINPRLFRPHEVPHLEGDSSKARSVLGWKPKVNFEQLVEMMYREDFDLALKL
jgi:GDPmannose 4,6-dehydratase